MGERYVRWGQFDEALQHWREYLQVVAQTTPDTRWHVLFSMGTVCQVDLATGVEFVDYTEKYWEDWPTNRIREPLTEIRNDVVGVWRGQRTQLPGDPGRALRMAYQVLVQDGYPYPGNEGSDRLPIRLGAQALWTVLWPARHRDLSNVVLAGNYNEAVVLGGDLRRYDAMFPRVLAVLDPQLHVTRAT